MSLPICPECRATGGPDGVTNCDTCLKGEWFKPTSRAMVAGDIIPEWVWLWSPPHADAPMWTHVRQDGIIGAPTPWTPPGTVWAQGRGPISYPGSVEARLARLEREMRWLREQIVV